MYQQKPGIFTPSARLALWGLVVVVGCVLAFCGGCSSTAPAADDAGAADALAPPKLGRADSGLGADLVNSSPDVFASRETNNVPGDALGAPADACPRTCDMQGQVTTGCLCPAGDGSFVLCKAVAPAGTYAATCCGRPCP
jgi:hypothetical protein